jgi:hypothetical protein
MSEPLLDSSDPLAASPCDVVSCPPPAERAAEAVSDPRTDLLALAATLSRTRSRRLLIEYLRLRRAAR